jgi:histidine ammonia-lyase
MATHAGTKARRIAGNAAGVVGIELLAAAQGCDFHSPMRSSEPLESVRALLRTEVPPLIQDRYLAPDIAYAAALVVSGGLADTAGPEGLPSVADGIGQ